MNIIKIKIGLILLAVLAVFIAVFMFASSNYNAMIVKMYISMNTSSIHQKLTPTEFKEIVSEKQTLKRVIQAGASQYSTLDMSQLVKHPEVNETYWNYNVALYTEIAGITAKLGMSMNVPESVFIQDPIQILTFSKHETGDVELDIHLIVNSGIKESDINDTDFLATVGTGSQPLHPDGPYQIISDYASKAAMYYPNYIGEAHKVGATRTPYAGSKARIGNRYNPCDAMLEAAYYLMLDEKSFKKVFDTYLSGDENAQARFNVIAMGYNCGSAVITDCQNDLTKAKKTTHIYVPLGNILAVAKATANAEVIKLMNSIIDNGERDEQKAAKVIQKSVEFYTAYKVACNELNVTDLVFSHQDFIDMANGKNINASFNSKYYSQSHRLRYSIYQTFCVEVSKRYLRGEIPNIGTK